MAESEGQMSTWISRDGKWFPAKEHAVLPHLQGTDKEIYDGPDRAALYELYEQKEEFLGQDFHTDAELIARVKQLGYKDVNEYALAHGWDAVKVEADFQKKAAVVNKHEIAQRVEEVNTLGGGMDKSGSNKNILGGFGEPEIRPLK
jgi:hypothetical protein